MKLSTLFCVFHSLGRSTLFSDYTMDFIAGIFLISVFPIPAVLQPPSPDRPEVAVQYVYPGAPTCFAPCTPACSRSWPGARDCLSLHIIFRVRASRTAERMPQRRAPIPLVPPQRARVSQKHPRARRPPQSAKTTFRRR